MSPCRRTGLLACSSTAACWASAGRALANEGRPATPQGPQIAMELSGRYSNHEFGERLARILGPVAIRSRTSLSEA
jgi:hypothetical protein